MTIWLNAHLSPAIAVWISASFGITAIAVRDLGLRESEDTDISMWQKQRVTLFS
jgi:predicted nuclease of predicted toxin-antitoxin system